MRKTTPAITGSEFKRLDQRRRHPINTVVLGDGNILETATVLCAKDVRSFKGATRYYGSRRTPRGLFVFKDGTFCLLRPESWVDGQVLYDGRPVYVFACSPLPGCPVRLALRKADSVNRILTAVSTLPAAEQYALRQVLAERAFGSRMEAGGDWERMLWQLELSTLESCLALLLVEPVAA